jgi:hypothetical protein
MPSPLYSTTFGYDGLAAINPFRRIIVYLSIGYFMNVGPHVGGVNVYLPIEACSKRGAGGRVSGDFARPPRPLIQSALFSAVEPPQLAPRVAADGFRG